MTKKKDELLYRDQYKAHLVEVIHRLRECDHGCCSVSNVYVQINGEILVYTCKQSHDLTMHNIITLAQGMIEDALDSDEIAVCPYSHAPIIAAAIPADEMEVMH